MILYFDSYITDIPFNKKFIDPNKWIRESVQTYAMPKKVDIAKYTLASYAEYTWSHVLVRYRFDDHTLDDDFEAYVKSLFPEAIILKPNSSNQTEYKKSATILNGWTDDEWIWYAPNNDHPIIASDLSIIGICLDTAKRFAQHNTYVSVVYSHFSEFINMPKRNSPFGKLFGKDVTVLEDNKHTVVYRQEHGDNTGIQIVNKNLFNYWFNSQDLGDAVIFRSEDIRKFYTTPNQVIIVPKIEIAAHFDGYSHTINGLAEIAADQVPPLFIPSGFFENEINIKYGFDEYDPAFTNINPLARKFSFEDGRHGTDLKCSQDQIPLFWKKRIKNFIANPDLSENRIARAVEKRRKVLQNPYAPQNKNLSLATLKYSLRHLKSQLGLY